MEPQGIEQAYWERVAHLHAISRRYAPDLTVSRRAVSEVRSMQCFGSALGLMRSDIRIFRFAAGGQDASS